MAFPLPDKDIEAYLRFILREPDLKGVALVAFFAGDGADDPLRTETIEPINPEGRGCWPGRTPGS